MRNTFFFFLFLLSMVAFESNSQSFNHIVDWEKVNYDENKYSNICLNCSYTYINNTNVPYFEYVHEGFLFENTLIENYTFESVATTEFSSDWTTRMVNDLKDINLDIQLYNVYDASQPILAVKIPVYVLVGGKIERITKVNYTLVKNSQSPSLVLANSFKSNRRSAWPTETILLQNNVYRLVVEQTGLYRLDKTYLNSMGINTDNLDPRTLKVYGTHCAILPELNAMPRPKDISENAIWVQGESDGKFDNEDFLVFYAENPNKWEWDSTNKEFKFKKHLYTKHSVYFLTFGGIQGKRMVSNPPQMNLTEEAGISEFDEIFRHEKDERNLIKSGKMWYGEEFDRQLSYTYSTTFANRVASEAVKIKTSAVGRGLVGSSLNYNLNGVSRQVNFSALGSLNYSNQHHTNPFDFNLTYPPFQGDVLNLNIQYSKPLSTNIAWLDYFELHVRRRLIHTGEQMRFWNNQMAELNSFKISIQAPNNTLFFDVTNPSEVNIQQTSFNNNTHDFKVSNAKKVKVYTSATSFLVPASFGRMETQNLHGESNIDYIIVTSPEFKIQAEDLANFHRTQNGFKVGVFSTNQIYNEFSCGVQDISAIRDFVKMLYDRATQISERPKYLLLFGDASFDYLDIQNANTNRVPIFQSRISSDPVGSFCSDDFFVLLDSLEGNLEIKYFIDLAVGRIPLNNQEQAGQIVQKIKDYHSAESRGNWRNNFTFVADDMDDSWEHTFVRESEEFADTILRQFRPVIFNKIYLDAFEQRSLGGGDRYPEATEMINNGIDRGSLVWNYIGHGGELGLASERVVEIPQINSWVNRYRLPFFITATCEFTRFDNPALVSGGENVLLNPKGGAIGLMTTTRLVFSTSNYNISKFIFENALLSRDSENKQSRIGDIYKLTKNRPTNQFGDRNFSMLGDPAIRLALPEFKVVLDSLNGKSLELQTDTLKALSKVTFKGRVLNYNNQKIQNFNGEVNPSVMERATKLQTRANDKKAQILDFEVQNSVLYRGRAEVKNGDFEFTFVVPKDISYRFEKSRISLYSKSSSTDAAGNESRIVVGGTADSIAPDNKGPQIELFLNDFTFVNASITHKSPLLLAKLFDENGINTAGSGVGREILATLDKNTPKERTIVLNEFFESELNSYQRGELSYQLQNLEAGKHTLTLKAWDTYNNSSEATIEFTVENSEDLVVRNLLNYPNPFTTRTEFHFDHNKQGQDLQVNLQIMTIGGRVVKSFYQDIFAAPSHIVAFEWDARDEFADKLAKGVYIYRLRIRTQEGKWVEKFEKLMIL
jgi:hypothetical protein